MSTSFDVAIVGGGPAGSVAAMVLSRGGRRVIQFECAENLTRKIGESLPASARPLLRHLDLLERVQAGPHLPSYGNLSAWGSGEISVTDFLHDPNGLGWHLDRAHFDHDLREESVAAGVQLVKARVQKIISHDSGWILKTERGDYKCGFVIDATGRQASIARQLGARILKDDTLTSVYTWIKAGAGDTDMRTLVESAAEGWWYTALLPDHTRVIAFHADAELAGELLRSPESWRTKLQETPHVRKAAGEINFPVELKCGPAGSSRLDNWYGPAWLAAGDAAFAFDPLSSQGIFNALYTGMKAAQAAEGFLAGDDSALAVYADRLRKIHEAYLFNRQSFYAIEQRYVNEKFWQRRLFTGAIV